MSYLSEEQIGRTIFIVRLSSKTERKHLDSIFNPNRKVRKTEEICIHQYEDGTQYAFIRFKSTSDVCLKPDFSLLLKNKEIFFEDEPYITVSMKNMPPSVFWLLLEQPINNNNNNNNSSSSVNISSSQTNASVNNNNNSVSLNGNTNGSYHLPIPISKKVNGLVIGYKMEMIESRKGAENRSTILKRIEENRKLISDYINSKSKTQDQTTTSTTTAITTTTTSPTSAQTLPNSQLNNSNGSISNTNTTSSSASSSSISNNGSVNTTAVSNDTSSPLITPKTSLEINSTQAFPQLLTGKAKRKKSKKKSSIDDMEDTNFENANIIIPSTNTITTNNNSNNLIVSKQQQSQQQQQQNNITTQKISNIAQKNLNKNNETYSLQVISSSVQKNKSSAPLANGINGHSSLISSTTTNSTFQKNKLNGNNEFVLEENNPTQFSNWDSIIKLTDEYDTEYDEEMNQNITKNLLHPSASNSKPISIISSTTTTNNSTTPINITSPAKLKGISNSNPIISPSSSPLIIGSHYSNANNSSNSILITGATNLIPLNSSVENLHGSSPVFYSSPINSSIWSTSSSLKPISTSSSISTSTNNNNSSLLVEPTITSLINTNTSSVGSNAANNMLSANLNLSSSPQQQQQNYLNLQHHHHHTLFSNGNNLNTSLLSSSLSSTMNGNNNNLNHLNHSSTSINLPLSEWSIEQVAEWLRLKNLFQDKTENFIRWIKENDMDGEALIEAYKQWSQKESADPVLTYGHWLKLQKHIKILLEVI